LHLLLINLFYAGALFILSKTMERNMSENHPLASDDQALNHLAKAFEKAAHELYMQPIVEAH